MVAADRFHRTDELVEWYFEEKKQGLSDSPDGQDFVRHRSSDEPAIA